MLEDFSHSCIFMVSGSWSFVLGLNSILDHWWLFCVFLYVGERETLWAILEYKCAFRLSDPHSPSQFFVTLKTPQIFSYHWLGKARSGNWKSPLFSLKPSLPPCADSCKHQTWMNFGRGKWHRVSLVALMSRQSQLCICRGTAGHLHQPLATANASYLPSKT